MGLAAGFKSKEEKEKDLERHKSSKHKDHTPKDGEPSRPSKKKDSDKEKEKEDVIPEGVSGWTAMIEDKLCYAGALSAAAAAAKAVSPATSEISIPKPLSPKLPSKEPKKGPYQLLIKERLMGIYLAVYIHRDLKSFVKGNFFSFSRSQTMFILFRDL
jgi:hypothetical protein